MRKLTILALVFVAVQICAAQGPATGRPPFGSFQDGEFDSVNLYNLNVNFAIPIVSMPGRGLNFNYALVYDSSVWKKAYISGVGNVWRPVTDASGNATWGWKRTDLVPGGIAYSTRQDEICSTERWHPALQEWIITPYYATYYYNYAYTDADGTRHPFDVAFYGSNPSQCVSQGIQIPTGPRTGTATDGSGILLDASSPTAPTVTEKFGGVSTFDSNGNFITKTTLTGGEVQWKDTLGRIVLRIVSGSDAGGNFRDYFFRDASGTEQKYRERLKTITVSSAFLCSGVQDYNSVSAIVVDKIELPQVDGITPTYVFSYDSKGRFTQVALPTGGTYTY
ncbi:MAG: hypothetical protein HY234_00865 [Acidobacteria bacterium]|nr:hypothetical protein [Acidobacteriota bacterium]